MVGLATGMGIAQPMRLSGQTPANGLRQTSGPAASGQIRLDHARPSRARVSVSPKRPTPTGESLVKLAAHGKVIADPPPAPLGGTLVPRPTRRPGQEVRQVGFLEDVAGCGPACDCGGPACGMEAVVVDPACGMETVYGEPSCGWETGTGPACGIEACPGCDGYGGGVLYDGGCSGLATCGCDACGPRSVPVFLPILRINWSRFQFFGGVQAFTGPMNFVDAAGGNGTVRNGSASFGFYEGFNEGRSLRRWLGTDLSAQFGVRATQSNIHGAEMTNQHRSQVFVTGGLFRRVDYGLQYGAVLDYLSDDWYFHGDLAQIRGEVSWKTGGCHEFGVRYMGAINDDRSAFRVRHDTGGLVDGDVAFEAADQYRFFYRRMLAGAGDATAFLGGVDDGNVLMGGVLNLPLRSKLMLSTSATYLVGSGPDLEDHRTDAWNISVGFVYRPGGPTGCGRYCRPMFDVADNGSFLVRKR